MARTTIRAPALRPSARLLQGVASTLEAAFALKAVAAALEDLPAAAASSSGTSSGRDGGGGRGGGGAARAERGSQRRFRYPSLASLAEGISDEERTLLRAIRECIKVGARPRGGAGLSGPRIWVWSLLRFRRCLVALYPQI